jgi:hypothetical protein
MRRLRTAEQQVHGSQDMQVIAQDYVYFRLLIEAARLPGSTAADTPAIMPEDARQGKIRLFPSALFLHFLSS